MIVVTNTIQIKSGFGEQVAERFKNPKGVHTMPGFAGMELLLDRKEESDELKVVTHWTDKASFDNWVNSDSFKQAHARRAPEGAENAAPAGGAQPMGGTAADGNPAPEHAAAAASGHPGGAGGHPGSGAQEAGHGAATASAPNPRDLMLGSKLSIHEVLFRLGAES
ncbi:MULTISPECIES: antibiotic biosynthesis monooxygenase [unclassified Paenibacillus]|uniref:antibiotic biosynthesis monooxygenase n=1 Tax=unclassified Paenibacillus TaxID=185978 RepID=UPI000953C296|nr:MULTISPECIES: antibiotic biosynthesis monooxygenase [unclassified Paenibacillus]ASS68173.1 antibiotic biosynthesis monooxygenase [Paenibacillus sp. RUD330]SIR70064.1 heme oxygenase (staphylobilin-producing) [Paenibacillus sp. RU4X]SIR77277.1 heme oxygenase (staphylobilin-producing) [Paenibacillus sp. RU4T]